MVIEPTRLKNMLSFPQGSGWNFQKIIRNHNSVLDNDKLPPEKQKWWNSLPPSFRKHGDWTCRGNSLWLFKNWSYINPLLHVSNENKQTNGWPCWNRVVCGNPLLNKAFMGSNRGLFVAPAGSTGILFFKGSNDSTRHPMEAQRDLAKCLKSWGVFDISILKVCRACCNTPSSTFIISTWYTYPKQPFFNGWKWWNKHYYVMIWNHPI